MLNKEGLVEAYAAQAGVSATKALEVVNTFLHIISTELNTGNGVVKFWGVGALKRVQVAARKYRNPRTGADMLLPATTRIKFFKSSFLQ